MCDKAADADLSTIKFVAESVKNQEMRNRVVSEDPFLIQYCSHKYKTQRNWDEAIFDCFVLRW